MKNYLTENLRNIGLFGHGSEGKTILCEAMLFNGGVIDRIGKVESGNTVSDYDPEEIKRTMSISAALVNTEWNDVKLNIIDTPGYFDFVGEVLQASKVVDTGIIVISGKSGLSVGAEKAFKVCTKNDIAKIVFVNQMDKENTNFAKCVQELQDKYGSGVVPFQLPIMDAVAITGYVDVVGKKAYSYGDKGALTEIDIPAELADQAEELYSQLIETAAENDEELLDKFFEGEELTDEEIQSGLKQGIKLGDVIPVFCGSAYKNLGINSLMNAIEIYAPSPLDKVYKDVDDNDIVCNVDGPASAFVFKTVVDPFVGKLSLFKVISGEIVSGKPIYNSIKEKSEKVNHVETMMGKKPTHADKLIAGDIGAIAKLQYTETNDTLCAEGSKIVFPKIEFPEPNIGIAILCEKEGDEDKVFSGLAKLGDEDLTFAVKKEEGTKQTLLLGTGDMQLKIICNRVKQKFGAGIVTEPRKVPYRETIKQTLEANGRHKKQSGGHGQFGNVDIRFSPISQDIEFEFVDSVVGGAVPKQYIPAVEKGLRECLPKGIIAGYPVVGLKADLYFGSYHAVDSSEMSFKMAASLAFKKLKDAKVAILEPILLAKVVIPDEYLGDVMGDMNKRRGQVMGMSSEKGGLQIVEAEVPEAEMFNYSTDLRSLTQAHGEFTAKFVRYAEVPSNLVDKIVEEANAEEK